MTFFPLTVLADGRYLHFYHFLVFRFFRLFGKLGKIYNTPLLIAYTHIHKMPTTYTLYCFQKQNFRENCMFKYIGLTNRVSQIDMTNRRCSIYYLVVVVVVCVSTNILSLRSNNYNTTLYLILSQYHLPITTYTSETIANQMYCE